MWYFQMFATGEELDPGPDSSITLDIQSPIFDDKSLNRSWSIPFTLDLSPANIKVLTGHHRLDSDNVEELYPAILWLGGIQWELGFIRIRSYQKGKGERTKISCNFENYNSWVLKEAAKIRIRDLDLGTVNVTQTTIARYECTLNLLSGSAAIVVVNGVAISGTGGSASAIIDNMVSQINAAYPGTASRIGNNLRFSPGGFIDAGLSDIDIWFQAGVGWNWTSVTTNSLMVAYAGNAKAFFDVDAISSLNEYRMAPVYAPNHFEAKNPDYSGYLNMWESGGYPLNVGTEHTLAPQIRLMYLLEKVMDQINLGLTTTTVIVNSELIEFTLFGNKSLDLIFNSEKVAVNAVSNVLISETGPRNIYQQSFEISDMVPDLTGEQVMELYVAALNGYWEQEGNTLDFTKRSAIFQAAPIDWTPKTDPAWSSVPIDEGFVFRYDPELLQTTPWDGQLEPYTLGKGTKPITMPFSTLPDATLFNRYSLASWKVPYYLETGRAPAWGVTGSPPLAILLLYRGLQQDSDLNTYPLLQSGATDYAGASTGSYSLDWNEATVGMFDNSYYPYSILYDTRRVSRGVALNINDLLKARDWETPLRDIRDPDGNLTGFIMSVRTKITQTRIEVSQVDFAQM